MILSQLNAPAGLAFRHDSALIWCRLARISLSFVYRIQIKGLRAKLVTDPLTIHFMFWMIGIVDGFQKGILAPNATDIHWWIGPLSFDTDREHGGDKIGQLLRWTGGQNSVHQHNMFPTIAKVVSVDELEALAGRTVKETHAAFVLDTSRF